MFEKPMTVAAAAVHVMAHGAQTHLFFTQTFEQGSYKDSGRKWMALERGADRGFRIAREEMLDSTLISQQEKELAAARAGPEDEELADGEISGYSLAVEDWVPPNIDEENAAAAALLDDAPVVVADLQMSGCPRGAAWARDVDLPPLPEVGSLPDADEARLRKEMQGETTDDDPDLEVLPVAGDPSRAVVALIGHTADSCETQEEYRIRIYLFTRKGRSWQTTTATAPLASYTYDDSLALAVDADGDGTLDIFTTRGAHRGGDDSDFWRHDIRVFWPPGLGCDGCDGCEGEGCGD